LLEPKALVEPLSSTFKSLAVAVQVVIFELGTDEMCVVSSVILGLLGPAGTSVQATVKKWLLENYI
jgi:hypothetical protein